MKTLKIILPLLFSILVLSPAIYSQAGNTSSDRPNILWITSEDNSTHLGCYGDEVAATPNLDALAERGVRYVNCFANAPVCAPVRSSWILGIPAITTGTFQMRSRYRVPDKLEPYPVLLKRAGYYVTNNSKTDYNNSSFEKEIWDECSGNAHYKNRPVGKPFFAIFNIGLSHEGQIFERLYPEKYPTPKTPAEVIKVPPYQVNTPEVVMDWRRVYDRIADMDSVVGRLLDELEELGEAENTIVFYCSDHAGIMLRTKRFLFDSGTRVPFIIYVPEKWKNLATGVPGSVNERLTQFIDMPRTYLSIAGAEVPDRMPGRIFMGPDEEKAPETVLLFSGRFDEAPDMSRAITDGRWKYIRNYEPDRPRYQMLQYPWNQSGQVSQYKEYIAGRTNAAQAAQYLPQPPEELYDTKTDPYEVNNLARDEKFTSLLYEMRIKLDEKMLRARDAGFIPEPIMADIDLDESTTIYEFAQSKDQYSLEKIMEIADIASLQDPDFIPIFREKLKDGDPIVRYWAILGLRVLGKEARPALYDIKQALEDPDASVRINAAICMGNLDMRKKAVHSLIHEALIAETDAQANWALNGLKYLGEPEAIQNYTKEELTKGSYSSRTYELLSAGGTMYKPQKSE